MSETRLDPHAKALAINLDGSTYGTFAEIGAGQEVARWFLTVGAASGTVAQTISAYDKTFSDDTYGQGTRYVSRDRLIAMLDREYGLLVQRLGGSRGSNTRFFVFADTVATRNYKGDNEQHGWIGMRFQTDPGTAPSDLLLHVNLLDPTAQQQQEALGVLGVNLVWSVHHARASVDAFLSSLFDDLLVDRMEIDVVELTGPAFNGQDARCWCLELVRQGLAHGVLFDQSFRAVEPSSIVRKRPLVLDRGRFETLEPFHRAMLQSAHRTLRAEAITMERDPLSLLELSMRPILGTDSTDDATLIARIDSMLKLAPALVTNLPESYRLMPYLRRFTAEPIRLVGGVTLLARTLETKFYNELPGSLLEGLGKLFASNVKFYVYPMPRSVVAALLSATGARTQIRDGASDLITVDDFVLPDPLDHLFRYLRDQDRIMPIEPV